MLHNLRFSFYRYTGAERGGAKRSDGPERRPLECARMRHQGHFVAFCSTLQDKSHSCLVSVQVAVEALFVCETVSLVCS